MDKVKKIDIHAHATPYLQYAPKNSVTKHSLVSPEQLFEMYDTVDIEKGVLLPLTSPEGITEQVTSSDCKFMADRYSDRFFWFCNVDPRAMRNNPTFDLSHLLNHYKGLGAKGVGELTANLYADDPYIDNLFYHCAECDMPVLIHVGPTFGNCYGIIDELGLPRIEKMLKKHKNLKLIGHSQPFWAEISQDVNEKNRNDFPTGKIKEGRLIELMRDYENLYCDFSANSGRNAFMRDPEYTAKFVEEFSNRLLYGCDICATFNTQHTQLNDFLDTMLKDNQISLINYNKIVRHNAEALLKLK